MATSFQYPTTTWEPRPKWIIPTQFLRRRKLHDEGVCLNVGESAPGPFTMMIAQHPSAAESKDEA